MGGNGLGKISEQGFKRLRLPAQPADERSGKVEIPDESIIFEFPIHIRTVLQFSLIKQKTVPIIN